MTYPPQQPGPYGQPGQPGQHGPPGQYGQWPQTQGQWPPGRQSQQPGGWGQQPYGTPPGGFAQPGGYQPPPGGPGGPGPGYGGPEQPPRKKKSALPWILAGAGVVLVAVVVALVFVLGDGGGGGVLGGSGNTPRAVAQSYANSINEKKEPDRNLYCQAFRQRAEESRKNLPSDIPTALPDIPGLNLSATVGDVTENGDTAEAAVRLDSEFSGQKVSSTHHLTLQKEDGAWRICGVDVDLPEIEPGG